MWRKGNARTLLVGMSAGTATKKTSVKVPQKSRNKTTT